MVLDAVKKNQDKFEGREIFSIAEAAIYSGLSTGLLYRVTRSGELKSYKIRGKKLTKIYKVDLDNWIKGIDPTE